LAIGLIIGVSLIHGLPGKETTRQTSSDPESTPTKEQSRENTLDDMLADADRLDPDWTLEKLQARRDNSPDSQNAASTVLDTDRQLRNKKWNLQILEKSLGKLQSPEQLSRIQEMTLRTHLRRHGDALRTALRLAELPRGRFSAELPDNPYAYQ